MSTSDRRAPNAARVPFEAMVEVGGALGPSFEAQAVNLSEEGMQLRTAYLPEVGQPITCRFDAGGGLVVVAAGEVLWNEDLGDGGEFGIRFTNLDTPSTVALQRILGLAEDGALPKAPMGKRVRLHIEGLASPMRARLQGGGDGTVRAVSELGFLQMGKPLHLEDAMTGDKRPAAIGGVCVEIDEGARVPQLVVSLRYVDDARHVAAEPPIPVAIEAAGEDEMNDYEHEHDSDPDHDLPADDAHAMASTAALAHEPDPHAVTATDDLEARDRDEEDGRSMKGALARSAAKVTPALEKWMNRAKTTIALMAAKRKGGSGDDVEIPVRRMTAPPPGGALHASGRKVVRGEIGEEPKLEAEGEKKPKLALTKKKAAVGAAIGMATLLAFVAIRKPAAPPQPVATTTPAESAAPAAPPPAPAPAPPPANDPLASAAMQMPTDALPSDPSVKPGKPQPFGNGSVGGHANVLRIKMDGAVEKIQGASQPTGFTVVLPGRKSLDAAAPLAAKDPRIAAIKVSNEPSGAELSVTFKDGVPNYQVRARKDTLEIALQRIPAEANAKAPHGGKKHKKAR